MKYFSNNPYILPPNSNRTETIIIQPDFQINNINFSLQVRVYDSPPENCDVLLLNTSEYIRYSEGTPVPLLFPFTNLTITTNLNSTVTVFSLSKTLSPMGRIFILMLNKNLHNVSIFYELFAISPLFYSGTLIWASCSISGILFLAIDFVGWKKYFLIGISVNLFSFFLRIFLLPSPPDVFGLNTFEVFNVELYNDMQALYIDWANLFINGFSPYIQVFNDYPFPPLFILTLGTFNMLSAPIWKLAIPLITCNIATGYFVYKITDKITKNERYAIYAMLAFLFNPFTIIYGSFAWLNPPFFVFFVTIAIYYTYTQKYSVAMLFLGIGTMYKQLAIIFFPLIVLNHSKDFSGAKMCRKVKKILKPLIIYFFTILVISIPFLLVNSSHYLYVVLSGQINQSLNEFLVLPSQGHQINFSTFFVWIGIPQDFLLIIAILLKYYILLGISFLSILYHLIKTIKSKNNIDGYVWNNFIFIETLFAALILVFAMQIFFPRGSYKYYLMLLTPFISIFHKFKDVKLNLPIRKGQKNVYIYNIIPNLLFSLLIFLISRYVYFEIILIWLILYLIEKRKQRNKNSVGRDGAGLISSTH